MVLPAFNAARTVRQAVVSILMQTYPNWELIIIDDGSSDKTLEILRGFNDPRIKIFSDGINKGLPTRLNEALDLSQGKYFARMDSDDICFPDRLRLQVEFLEAHPEIDLVGTRALLFNNHGQAVGLFPFSHHHEEISKHPWNGFHLPHPTWMGRLAWFQATRYRQVDRAEDQDLLLRSYSDGRFACLPEMLFAYRVRDRVSLRINVRARTSLLKSQAEVFSQRSQWVMLFLAGIVYGVKMLSDFFKAIGPWGSSKENVSEAVQKEWHTLKCLVEWPEDTKHEPARL